MAEYVLITDSACDILPEKLREWDVELIRLAYLFTDDGKEMLDNDQPMKEFYNEMRGGRVAKTSGVNENTFATVFTAFLEEGKDILYLAFSSGLSVTCENGKKVAAQLAEYQRKSNGYIKGCLGMRSPNQMIEMYLGVM